MVWTERKKQRLEKQRKCMLMSSGQSKGPGCMMNNKSFKNCNQNNISSQSTSGVKSKLRLPRTLLRFWCQKRCSAVGKLVGCQLQLVHAAQLWQLLEGCGAFRQFWASPSLARKLQSNAAMK